MRSATCICLHTVHALNAACEVAEPCCWASQVAPVPVSLSAQQISQLSLDAEPPPVAGLPRFTHFLCAFPLILTGCIISRVFADTRTLCILRPRFSAATCTLLMPWHLLARSCVSPDAPKNPVLYFLGRFDPAETKFILEGAKGPIRLDLGDILYAPNIQTDAVVGTFGFHSVHQSGDVCQDL